MTALPRRCVVDTNVAATANGANPTASHSCVVSSARALQAMMAGGHVFVDDGGRIVAEYRANLSAKGQPGPGDAFLKWVLTHEWGGLKVTRVEITPRKGTENEFEELLDPPPGVFYDPSDRKFLAVAAAHPDHPPILQSLDSKWWGWQEALAELGIVVHFLCPLEIAAKYQEKTAHD